jgi:C4-type Zn-finger protein
MNALESRNINCPYCGEIIEVVLDCSVPHQRYIEDCQVCCRPINFDVTVDEEGDAAVFVATDDE